MERERREGLERGPEITRFLLSNVRRTGEKLGSGSYGSVDEVVVDGVICAAKLIHEILLDVDMNNPGAIQTATRKYVAECQLMSDLRHQHIVQFLGLCFLEGSSLPALVMEKLVASLDDILENTLNIPLGVKKSFLTDVIKGLLYLHNHTPTPIIHRDLSARNIFLNSAMVAKITDLGNSRMVQFQPGQIARTLSRAPGTIVYMPPEALDETASTHYGPSLDIFSFGHVALFTLTQAFPRDLLGPTYADPDNRKCLLARSEVERRQPYFSRLYQQLTRGHPLVQLVEHCLDNDPEDRPSTMEVLQQLEAVEIADPYQHLTKLDMIRLLQQQTDSQSGEQVQRLQTQLQQMQLDVAESRTQRNRAEGVIREKDDIIRGKDEIIHRLQEVVTDQEATIKQKDQEKERAVQEKVNAVQEKDRAVQEKERAIQEKERAIWEKDPQRDEQVQRLQTQLQQMQLEVAESRTQRDGAEGERDRAEGVIRVKDEIIREKDEIIHRLQEVVRNKDATIKQKDQEKERAVQVKERAVREKKMAVLEKERAVQEKERAVQEKEKAVQEKEEVRQKGDLPPSPPPPRLPPRPPRSLPATSPLYISPPTFVSSTPKPGPPAANAQAPKPEEEGHYRSWTSRVKGLFRTDTKEELRQKDDLLYESVPTPQEVTTLYRYTTIRFQQLKPMPVPLCDAQAVIYRGKLYVGGDITTTGHAHTLCVYNFQPDTWDTIKTPTSRYALAVYQGHIVLAGGCLGVYIPTNELWTTDQHHNFKKTIPPMNSATWGATAITTETHLIIAGGFNDGRLDTVQAYDGQQWTLVQPLPVPASDMKYVCRNDTLYLIGGDNQDKKVFYTSLPSLLHSAHQPKAAHTATPTVWNTLKDAPFAGSCIAVLRSELVAVGGRDNLSYTSPSIYKYTNQTRTWDKMYATLPQPLSRTCSITLPTGELMVIGGVETDRRYSLHIYKGTLMD